MQSRRSAAILAVLLCGAIWMGAATKKRKPTPAAVSAALRAASLKKVKAYLDDPPVQAFAQPGALAPLFEQLSRMSANGNQPALHMIQFGDSHTAADEWTGALRGQLQAQFGDGGSGFSLAGHPFAGYRRFDISGGASSLWQAVGLRSGAGDGYYGLAGVGVETDRAGQFVYVDTECDSLDVDFLRQPGGGGVAFYVDEERREDFSTDGDTGPGSAHFEVPLGLHRFKLVTRDAQPVRLFGWEADRNAGVTYEALGINGAEAPLISKWNPEMLATYLQHRNPGLIVLSYGTNEASDVNWTAEAYEAAFSAVLARLRQAVPAASILVLGPGDRWYRVRGVGWRILPGIDWVIAAQKRACRMYRCAFWDTRERMGGKGAMKDWVYAGLGQADFVHFTAAGYHRLAAVLYADLMEQFAAYKEARPVGPASYGHAN